MKNHTFRAGGVMTMFVLIAVQSLAQSTYEPYTFTTLAGGGGICQCRCGWKPHILIIQLTIDGGGNLYVADTFNHVIRKVSSGGTVTTLARVAGQPGNVEGTGSGARFYFSTGVAIPPLPSELSIKGATNDVVISWPASASGWTVQQNNELNTTKWTDLTNTPDDDGTNNSITISPTARMQSYRLNKQ